MTDPARSPETVEALIAHAHRFAALGLSPGGSGNLSIRLQDTVMITPTGSALARLASEQLSVLRLADGDLLSGPAPSKEAPIHLGVYRNRPDVHGIVHLHSPAATAVSCLPVRDREQADLPPFTPYQVMRFADLPVAPYARPGTADLADGVVERLREPGRSAVLMAHHGSVVVGGSITKAADLAEELESAAQVALLLRGTGAAPLPTQAVHALR